MLVLRRLPCLACRVFGHAQECTPSPAPAQNAAVIRNPAKEPEVAADFTRRGIRLFRDTATLYKECPGIDLMCIPTGIASHEPLTVEALENGCDVLVEKPLCGCMEAARSIVAAEKRTGKTVMIGYQHIYLPGIQAIKRHLVSGRLGRVRRITAAGLREAHPHDVVITKDAPNYTTNGN